MLTFIIFLIYILNYINLNNFFLSINVNNSGEAKMGTVRIFIAPRNDERGLPWQFAEQRTMFIEMDRFVTTRIRLLFISFIF